jgi:uncharacterized protein (TIGR02145 family)
MRKVNVFFFSIVLVFLSRIVVAQQYASVVIGKQQWVTKNLNVDTFRNGDLIPEAKTQEEWEKAGENGQPAWCYYDNKPEKGEKYGRLYNVFAVKDPRGLAPEGWHVPSEDEWYALQSFLQKGMGKQLKSKTGWEGNKNGDDVFKFCALPAGRRKVCGMFDDMGTRAQWWSSSTDETDGTSCGLNEKNDKEFQFYLSFETDGLSVRCVKD